MVFLQLKILFSMNIKTLSILMTIGTTMVSCGSWVRIGDLTSISNRNIDDSKKYVLLHRDVEAVTSSSSDAMEQAIDELAKKHEGEFVRNVKVYVKDNGKKVKVIGDVWGTQSTNVNVIASANANIQLEIGDAVVFKQNGKIIDGRIIGINSNKLIIEYGKGKKTELKFDQVTKTNK